MEEWSQKKPDWADGGNRRCAASVAEKKATVWIKKDAKHACSRCTGMGSVCVAVVDGTTELLPLKKPLPGEDGNAVDASEDGFWFVPKEWQSVNQLLSLAGAMRKLVLL